MAHIPETILKHQPLLPGLKLRSRGKVRDTYVLSPSARGKLKMMLVVASDRCSIFDFVLRTFIPQKGSILTALNAFFVTKVINNLCGSDLIACGQEVDQYLPPNLRNNPDLQKRASIVEVLPAPDMEDIVRLYLTGSGWQSYQKDGTVCGHRLPPGLIDGSKLPYPLYTPTTKAQEGHDEHISADSVANRYGIARERLAIAVAGAISAYAERRGIILADTKFEFSSRERLVLVDEKGTPDSSRFWDALAWQKAHAAGRLPPSFDKQFVREWGKKALIEKDENGRKREPTNKDDLSFVDVQIIPEEIVRRTTQIYRYIFWRLTGMTIEAYQNSELGIKVRKPCRRIEVLVGSESDLPQAEAGLRFLEKEAVVTISAISCHRNPAELRQFSDRLAKAHVIIAGAGMAAALPGIVKSNLCDLGHPEIPVIGVAFKGKSDREDQAAILSIECLPGSPVELDPEGKTYFGPEGFTRACKAAVEHEFLPKEIAHKPAKFDLNLDD